MTTEDKQCRSYLVFYIHSNRQNYKPYTYIGNTSGFLCMSTWLGKKSTETITNTIETENMRQRPVKEVNWWDSRGEGSEVSFHFIKTQESQHPSPLRAQRTSDHTGKVLQHRALIVQKSPIPTHFYSESNRKNALFQMEHQEWHFPHDPPVWRPMWKGQWEREPENRTEGRGKKSPLFCFPLQREREGGSEREREGGSNAILTGTGPTATKTFR